MKMSGLAQQDGHRRRHFPRYGITDSACALSRNTKTRHFSEIRNQLPLCAYVALRTRQNDPLEIAQTQLPGANRHTE